MPTLYAYMVAIDEYPNPRHRLQGCVRDQKLIEQYLTQWAETTNMPIHIHKLTDDQATRQAVVEGFNHFEQAKDGDICLFTYSGHGSRNEAAEEFWHLEPDKLNESMVCWDSRSEGGRDLLDKELSYLIWKANQKRDVDFIAIMDCCHAGSATRDLQEGVWSRMAEKGNDLRKLQEMEGYEHYEKGADGKLSPPRGRHLMLGAARNTQTAKEIFINGEVRGVFTYSLIETLRMYSGQLTYGELVNHMRIRLAQRVREQAPQLEVIDHADPDRIFLSDQKVKSKGSPLYLVSYQKDKGWHVNAGSLDGFQGGSEGSPTELELQADNRKVTVQEVYPDYATVNGMRSEDSLETVFRAAVTRWGSGGMKVAFGDPVEAAPKAELTGIIAERVKDGLFELVDNPKEARYLIEASEGTIRLVLPGEERPVFRRVPGYTRDACIDFVTKVRMIARYIQLLELANPATTIQDNEVKIELLRLSESGKRADTDPVELVDWHSPSYFRYFYDNGKWTLPAFQLKITNTGSRSLWFSALFMSSNFGVFNQLLAKQELGPGEEVWMLDVAKGIPHRTIMLQVDPTYHAWGINEEVDYIKVMVSTDEFSTDRYNQPGLPLDDRQGATRSISLWEDMVESDWLAKELELRIVRPMEPVLLQGGARVSLLDLQVSGPSGLLAKCMLNSLQEATAGLSVPYSPFLENGEEWESYLLSGGHQQSPGMSVVELYEVRHGETVSAAAPLTILFPEGTERILPYHCDPTTGKFSVLAHGWEDGILTLQALPPATPTPYKGLESSVKIFLSAKGSPVA